MRKSASLLIPLTLIAMYYALWIVLISFLLKNFPGLAEYFPIGGVDELAASNDGTFEPVYTSVQRTVLAPHGPIRLAIGTLGAIILTVPVLSPRLSSLWIGLVTPLPVGVARPLVDSLRNEVTVRADRAAPLPVDPLPLREAIERALDHNDQLDVPSRWSDANSSPARLFAGDPEWAGGTLLVDRQVVETSAGGKDLFWAFSRMGGSVGYYTYGWAWRLRGLLDALVGGVGLRRGRRHPQEVRLHDTVDFWRVSAVASGEFLQLSAEMRLPGEAWLEWRVGECGDGRQLEQTAYFRPRGLAGRMYWYAMLPVHHLIFGRMARKISRAAEGRASLDTAV